MKKLLSILSVLALSVALLSACSNNAIQSELDAVRSELEDVKQQVSSINHILETDVARIAVDEDEGFGTPVPQDPLSAEYLVEMAEWHGADINIAQAQSIIDTLKDIKIWPQVEAFSILSHRGENTFLLGVTLLNDEYPSYEITLSGNSIISMTGQYSDGRIEHIVDGELVAVYESIPSSS